MSQRDVNFTEKITSIILCAGEGKRAKNISENISKPLIKITSLGNQSILFLIISSLKKLHLDQIVIVTGHLSKGIEDYVNLPQIQKEFGKKHILIHNSGDQYKLGPLFSFLSIITNNKIYREDKIFTLFPGDTVFDFELLREIINKLLENSIQVIKHSIVFYRKIRTNFLINQFEKHYPNHEKTISHLKAEEKASKYVIKEILQDKLSSISDQEYINQIIPVFVFNHTYVEAIKEYAQTFQFRTIREVVNLMIEKKKQFFAISVNPEYNFYDIDTHLDLRILNELKKDGQ